MTEAAVTLKEFLVAQPRGDDDADSEELAALVCEIAEACKSISRELDQGALGIPATVEGRAPGTTAALLAGVSRDCLLDACAAGAKLAASAYCGEGMMRSAAETPRRRYLLLADPLQGADLLDVNVPAGTLFAIAPSPRPGMVARPEDFALSGEDLLCAGFALYGAATLLVLATRNSVDGFTLERNSGEFLLSHRHLKIPVDTRELSLEICHERFWEPPVKRYVAECLAGKSGARGQDFALRGAATPVAEAWRVLMRGGLFLHPRASAAAERQREPELLCQAQAIAFIIEQAGGAASTGRRRVMSIEATALDQRVPLIFGSKREVERLARYHQQYLAGAEPDGAPSPLFGTRSLFRQ